MGDAGGGAPGVGRRVLDVVEHPVDRRGGHVHPRVGRGVVDEEVAVVARDRAVAEEHVGDVADALFALGRHQVAARLVDHLARVVEVDRGRRRARSAARRRRRARRGRRAAIPPAS